MSVNFDHMTVLKGPALPLAVVAAFAASATVALACSCIRWQTPEAQLEEMDLAVVARAVWTRHEEGRGPYESVTLFTIERTLKGPVRQHWRIAHLADHNGPTCGIEFGPGERIVLMATMEEGRLATSACHQALFPVVAYERAVARRR